jgi:chromate transporter
LDAVAVAMITPGAVVITVAFIGFLVAGLAGAVMASIGIFLPVYLFTIVPAPWFKRHRDEPPAESFRRRRHRCNPRRDHRCGSAARDACYYDAPTAIIALVSLSILLRFKVTEPIIVSISGLVGLVLWPLLQR